MSPRFEQVRQVKVLWWKEGEFPYNPGAELPDIVISERPGGRLYIVKSRYGILPVGSWHTPASLSKILSIPEINL